MGKTYRRDKGGGLAYRVLMGKPEGKRTLGRLRHKWSSGKK
jgi:hypothetical protein